MKRLTFYSLMILLTACGTQQPSTSSVAGAADDAQPFIFACTAASPEGATLQSLRVFVNGDTASLTADNFAGPTLSFTAEGSVVVQNSISAFAAAWNGAAFSAEQVQGRIYAGSYTTDGAPTAVRCIRVETSDRSADEFSLACAPSMQGVATAALPHTLYLTYEERELEMFVNPADAVEIFDLELATGLRVTDNYVTASWTAHNTTFTGESYDGDEFTALLYYRGSATYAFRCWKL